MLPKSPQITIYWLEALAVAGLLLWANAAALTPTLAGLVAFLNVGVLVSLFFLLRHALARIARPLAHLLFAFAVTVLSAEVIIATFSGLHLSRFILSLALQPQAASQIGLASGWVLLPAALAVAAYWGSMRARHSLALGLRPLAAFLLVCVGVSQALFAFLLYQRNTALLTQQPDMVFFRGLHHYYADRMFSPLFGPRVGNPVAEAFALPAQSASETPAWSVARPKDVLVVVIDSLRSQDIAADPAIAPNLARWGRRGFLSLSHRSISNCTHFSMHTLFTGDLATDYGLRRRHGYSPSLFHSLQKAGYVASSAEASSLDWYDLATTYMQGVERSVATAQDFKAADQFVFDQTLVTLLPPSDRPRLHLAYFNGPHFSAGDLVENGSMEATYLSRVEEADTLIGQLLSALHQARRLDDMLVVITADHGEQLFEEGVIGHGSLLNREQTMIPFLAIGADSPTDWVRSHRDLVPLIRMELTGETTPPPLREAEILAGCDYAVPHAFAVLNEDGQTDFDFEDGLLSPAEKTTDKKAAQKAALALIRAIRD